MAVLAAIHIFAQVMLAMLAEEAVRAIAASTAGHR
jgi:hypothetical protein